MTDTPPVAHALARFREFRRAPYVAPARLPEALKTRHVEAAKLLKWLPEKHAARVLRGATFPVHVGALPPDLRAAVERMSSKAAAGAATVYKRNPAKGQREWTVIDRPEKEWVFFYPAENAGRRDIGVQLSAFPLPSGKQKAQTGIEAQPLWP